MGTRRNFPAPVADATKARVPVGHPLEMWELEEAVSRTKLSASTLCNGTCPRAKVGTRLLFDPIETIAWVRLFLSHTVSDQAAA